jgi:chemotaxis protein methyltransferase CheR
MNPAPTPPSPGEGHDDYRSQLERPPWFDARLSTRDFQRLGAFIEARLGIRMPDVKKIMLESRLRSRLKTLGLGSFTEYCALVLRADAPEAEVVHLLDHVTTNKTDFFREPGHFEHLARHAVPTLLRERGAGVTRELVVWSAGCSTGEEPYTLAMVLSELTLVHPGLRFQILATDISTEVLARAVRGVYGRDRITPVPPALRARYLLSSKDPEQEIVRVSRALRDRVRFRRLNLMDEDYRLGAEVDVIFCRNVFIYFDRRTQERVLARFCHQLAPGGYVYLGHSEAISSPDLPLRAVAPTTYRAIAGAPAGRG